MQKQAYLKLILIFRSIRETKLSPEKISFRAYLKRSYAAQSNQTTG